MSVLAVPKSIDKSLEKNPRIFLKIMENRPFIRIFERATLTALGISLKDNSGKLTEQVSSVVLRQNIRNYCTYALHWLCTGAVS